MTSIVLELRKKLIKRNKYLPKYPFCAYNAFCALDGRDFLDVQAVGWSDQ